MSNAFDAVRSNNVKLIHELAKSGKGIDVFNAREEFNITPMHLAVSLGHADCVRALLQVHVDVNGVLKNGLFLQIGLSRNSRSPLEHAIICGQHECVQILVKAGAMDHKPSHSSIFETIVKVGYEERIFKLVNDEHTLNCFANLALRRDYVTTVSELVEIGRKFDTDSLMVALRARSRNVSRFLMDAGVEVNDECLFRALSNGCVELVHQMIESGAKPNSECLLVCIRRGFESCIFELIDAGAEMNHECLIAAMESNLHVFVRPIVDKQDRLLTERAVHKAVACDSFACVRAFFELGVEIPPDLLRTAILKENLTCVRVLLECRVGMSDWYIDRSNRVKNRFDKIVDVSYSIPECSDLMRMAIRRDTWLNRVRGAYQRALFLWRSEMCAVHSLDVGGTRLDVMNRVQGFGTRSKVLSVERNAEIEHRRRREESVTRRLKFLDHERKKHRGSFFTRELVLDLI